MLDVLIVGGGPVGLYLGCLLAQRSLKFQVLEKRTAPGPHSRAIGIHPPALELLADIGLASAFLHEGLCISSGVVRGEGGVLGQLSLKSASSTFPFVLSLPQQRTETLLEARLEELAPLTLRRGVTVTALRDLGSHVQVEAQDAGKLVTLEARFVVGADGIYSAVRGCAGVAYPGGTYPDTYLMGDFPDTTSVGPVALIYLLGRGVVECFPLPGGLRRWVVRTDRLRRDASAADLGRMVLERTGELLPQGECSMLSAFEVGHHAARHMVTGNTVLNTVLIGDAAHQVSPIGGQGMNLGWLDAAALVGALEQALNHPGRRESALRRFERVRQRSAKIATWQAELNMFMGRPVSAQAQQHREWLVRRLMSRPLQSLLARAYTMRWL